MTTFPALIPSGRTFTPGEYPHTAFVGMNGRSNRVRNSNVMLSSQVRLTFLAITEAQMLLILTHYQGQQGTFQSFTLPDAIWNGVDDTNDYQLIGYGWRYIEPPSVRDAMCADAYDVELTLGTVPPEGTAAAGLDFLAPTTLEAGSASAQFSFNVVASLDDGDAATGVGVVGIDESVGLTLAAGEATGGSAATDPDFSNVSLLLHMDGSNGSTTFADSSNAARTITVTGNTQISTAQSKFGGASALFDGSNDYLRATASTDLQFPGDFTIEIWTYPLGTGDYIIGSSGTDPNTQVFRLNQGGSGRLSFYLNGIQVFSATAAGIAANTWQHLAISRSGSSTRMFVNGTQIGSTNTSWIGTFRMDVVGTFFFNGSRYNLPPSDFHGYIDDLRITKGVARYTANFTPPTEPFPDS